MSRFPLGGLTLAGLVTLAVSAACGSNSTPTKFTNTDDSGTGDDQTLPSDDAGDDMNLFNDTGGNPTMLVVAPPDAIITTSGSPKTQQYTATDATSMQQVTANWSLDSAADIGTIDSGGLFKATGTVGGVGTITATSGMATGQTSVTVNVTITENTGNISPGDQTKLKNGGKADASYRWLYPYDGTVFPRGLQPALMQMDGTAADEVYVHMSAKHVTYDGFFGASSPTAVSLSPTTWANILDSVGAGDPLTVQVTKMSGGQVTGPATETWTVAQGSMHGTVYYTSYTSQLAPGGGTLKIKIGTTAQVLVGNCNNCHSVAAAGNVLAASYGHQYDATYDLANNANKVAQVPDCAFCVPGIYPDGSILLSTYGQMIPGVWNSTPNTMYDAKTGATKSFTGLSGVHAAMPAFSPDGAQLVFNHEDAGGGHTLAIAPFNVKTLAFGAVTDIVTDATLYPSYPQFLPDGKSVVYHDDTNADYATWSGNKAELRMVDIGTKKNWQLNSLDGYKPDGVTTYLPYGTSETGLNYEPTVLPIAVGGYQWVVFTSRRFYGNTMTPQNQPDPWSSTPRKKLYVAPIDIGGAPGKDASHPAIYLDGQEFQAGNMRGFWVLDPCKMTGSTCETADECCNGDRCRSNSDGGSRTCVPPMGGCSQEYESCKTAADCCDPQDLCINGRCAVQTPH